MRRTILAAVIAAIAAAGCGFGPKANIFVIDDPRGQTIKIGSVLHLQWECQYCSNVFGSAVLVQLVREDGNVKRVAFGPLTGSTDWYTERDLSDDLIGPGLYTLWYTSYPVDDSTDGTTDRNVVGESGAFRLAP